MLPSSSFGCALTVVMSMVIDACRPFERLKDFPPVARARPPLRARVEAKFADVLAKFGI